MCAITIRNLPTSYRTLQPPTRTGLGYGTRSKCRLHLQKDLNFGCCPCPKVTGRFGWGVRVAQTSWGLQVSSGYDDRLSRPFGNCRTNQNTIPDQMSTPSDSQDPSLFRRLDRKLFPGLSGTPIVGMCGSRRTCRRFNC